MMQISSAEADADRPQSSRVFSFGVARLELARSVMHVDEQEQRKTDTTHEHFV